MDRLKNQKMELFCQLIAKEGLTPSDACFRANYGKERHPLPDQYHANMGSRLIKRQDIQERIATIREQEKHKSSDYRNTLENLLKRAIGLDLGKYYKSINVTLNDGISDTNLEINTKFNPVIGDVYCNDLVVKVRHGILEYYEVIRDKEIKEIIKAHNKIPTIE